MNPVVLSERQYIFFVNVKTVYHGVFKISVIRACYDIACVACFDIDIQHHKPSFRQRNTTTILVQQNEEY